MRNIARINPGMSVMYSLKEPLSCFMKNFPGKSSSAYILALIFFILFVFLPKHLRVSWRGCSFAVD